MSKAFQEWVVDFGGSKKVAEKLKVSVDSIKHWKARKGSPKVGTIVELVKLSKGALTYESIIESTYPQFSKRGR